MAFWCRIKQKKLVSLSNQFKRCYFHIPRPCLVNPIALNTRTCALEKPISVIWNAQIDFACNARFFAAPVQAKPKREEKDTSGPRLNEKITAESVRLVTEEGHLVVSRREALERARRLDVDLVEVQRNAKPPVCKLMNYHKEKYKQQVKEKDRCKSKSEVTLRKGDCKEVRFSGKTEQKDLQMKADMVKRLMERGYRVKCMAMGTEDQDLGGLLSRLSVLIEDVSIVESGPRVEKKQAYVIVRHVKFGPSKKGPGKKASKVVGSMSSEVQTIASLPPTMNPSMINESPTQFEETVDLESGENETLSDEEDMIVEDIDRNKPTWSVFDANDDSDNVFDFGDEAKVEPQKLSSATNNFPVSPGPLVDSTRTETVLSSSQESLLRTENGYKMGLGYKDPPARSMDGKGTSTRDSTRSEPQFPKQDRQLQLDLNGPPSTRETKHMENPSSSAPGYGIFGAPKVNDTPEKNGLLADNRYKKEISFDSTRQPRPRGVSAYPNSHSSNTDRGGRPGIDNGGQGKWGIFNGESSNVMPSRNSESRAKFQR